MTVEDDYTKNVIQKGDEGSTLFATILNPTIPAARFTEQLSGGMHGKTVLRIPQQYVAVVHSSGGRPEEKDPRVYTRSVVENLVAQASLLGAEPVAMANVYASSDGDLDLIKAVASELRDSLLERGLANINGENAVHGPRNADITMAGTMISVVSRGKALDLLKTKMLEVNDNWFVVFDPNGEAVYANADGAGTKPESLERAFRHSRVAREGIVMTADDVIKIRGRARAASFVTECSGAVDTDGIRAETYAEARRINARGIVQSEYVGDRIRGYAPGMPALSFAGTLVSTLSEDAIRNPPRPEAGNTLVAYVKRGEENGRCNGFTSKQKTMREVLGPVWTAKYGVEHWHQAPIAGGVLDFLTAPSVLMYPLFRELLQQEVASSVFHLSGGSFNGKFAKPLAKENLFADLSNLPAPSYYERMLADLGGFDAQTVYGKWPMGVDGIAAVRSFGAARSIADKLGFDCFDIGKLVRAEDTMRKKAGVRLVTPYGDKAEYLYDIK